MAAINHGGIGAVIAHEITHGYDDKGSKYDGDGNLNNWWTDEDLKLFEVKTLQMGKQAESYSFYDQENVYKMNPHLTMGENLADLGGLTLSMRSLLKTIPNTTDKKEYLRVFFRSWANVWKCNMKKETAIINLITDPHAPKEFRGNMVKHIDEFYECFNVIENDPMYISSKDRVKMW